MSKQKTTIILGAGASVHYGFPTGNDLIDSIIKSSHYLNLYILGGDYYLTDIFTIKKFSRLLDHYDPISIDRFLTMYRQDARVVETGKQLIAHEIIKRQNAWRSTRSNKENWYKYLYDFVFEGNDYTSKLDNDEFRIITFNYDLSLEHFFHARLEQTPLLSKEDAWNVFLKFNSKIHHVYGSVYDYIKITEAGVLCRESSEDRYTSVSRYAEKANHSRFQEASHFHNNIRVIGEERENGGGEKLKEFKRQLQQSHKIYILGFGFDDVNMELIGLDNSYLSNFCKAFYCTNYNGINIISEKFQSICKRNHKGFISNKTVYGALSEDFVLD